MTDPGGLAVDSAVLSSEAGLVGDAAAEFEAYRPDENMRMAATAVPDGSLAAALLNAGDVLNTELDSVAFFWQCWVNEVRSSGASFVQTDEGIGGVFHTTDLPPRSSSGLGTLIDRLGGLGQVAGPGDGDLPPGTPLPAPVEVPDGFWDGAPHVQGSLPPRTSLPAPVEVPDGFWDGAPHVQEGTDGSGTQFQAKPGPSELPQGPVTGL